MRFPPIRLLLGLANREEQPDKTPWWLLLLRLAMAALLILGVSHPLYAPGRVDTLSSTPLLLVVDDSWAAAKDWDKRREIMTEILDGAASAGAPGDAGHDDAAASPAGAGAAGRRRRRNACRSTCTPRHRPGPRRTARRPRQRSLPSRSRSACIWLTDGIDDGKAKDFAAGPAHARPQGGAASRPSCPMPPPCPLALATPGFEGGRIKVTALRAPGGPEQAAARRRPRRQWPQLRRDRTEIRQQAPPRPKA